MWREIDDNTDEETAEVYSVKQPVKRGFSYQPFAGTVKVSMFLPPSFTDPFWNSDGYPIKLPMNVRSALRKAFHKTDW